MSRSLRSRSRLSLGLAATFVAMLPSAALAADAPLRYVGIDATGARVANINWVAASEDAHELVGTQMGPHGGYAIDGDQVVDRDVITGTTTVLAGPTSALVAASTDLRKLLIRTTQSHSPKDTNSDEDYYVLNRDTGQYTLISADSTGKALGSNQNSGPNTEGHILNNPALSGDGSTAQFYTFHVTFDSQDLNTTDHFETDRVNVATGAITKLPTGDEHTFSTHMDDAGRVAVADNAIYVDGVKKVDIAKGFDLAVVSPDGGSAAAWNPTDHAVAVANLSTGAVKTYSVPKYAGGLEHPSVRLVANGGTSVVLSDVIQADGNRLAFGRLDTATGNFGQIGGNIKYSNGEFLSPEYPGATDGDIGLITPNQQFAITGLSIAQLGQTPLPGTEPTAPIATKLSDYLYVSDTSCTWGGFWNLFRIYHSAGAGLATEAQGTDLRRPVSFTGTATKGGKVLITGTLGAGQGGDIPNTGNNGGWQVDGTVKFTDGTTLTGTVPIASHGSPACSYPFPG